MLAPTAPAPATTMRLMAGMQRAAGLPHARNEPPGPVLVAAVVVPEATLELGLLHTDAREHAENRDHDGTREPEERAERDAVAGGDQQEAGVGRMPNHAIGTIGDHAVPFLHDDHDPEEAA